MVFSSIKERKDVKQNKVSVREAFTLWDLLRTKYKVLDLFKTLQNDVHDPDLKKLIELLNGGLEKNTKDIEKLLERFSIVSPDRNRKALRFPKNTEVLSDEMIAGEMIIFFEENLLTLLRGFKTAVNNDDVRNFLRKILYTRVNQLDTVLHYMKLKGWMETPPLFLGTSLQVKEKVSVVEIYHLWHHLTYRYDNINTTEIFKAFAFDGDFKLTLEMGLRTLRKQIAILEKELQYFGVPLPNAPGVVTFNPGNTEILKDDHMFRTLLDGLQGAALIHLEPLKECTLNDRVRRIFKDLFIAELGMIDLYYKYGKLKGWFHPVPLYGT